MNCDNLTNQDFNVLKNQLKKTSIANYPIALYAIFWIIMTKIIFSEEVFQEFATYSVIFALKNMELFARISKFSMEKRIPLDKVFEKYINDSNIQKYLAHVVDLKKNIPKYLELIGYINEPHNNVKKQLQESVLFEYTVEEFRMLYDYVLECVCTNGPEIRDDRETDKNNFNVFLKNEFENINVHEFIQKTSELANKRKSYTRYNIFVRISEFLSFDDDDNSEEIKTNEKILVDMLMRLDADVTIIQWIGLLIDRDIFSHNYIEYTYEYNVNISSSLFLYLIEKDNRKFMSMFKGLASMVEQKFDTETMIAFIEIENRKK